MVTDSFDFTVAQLGIPTIPSPLGLSHQFGDLIANYVNDDERVVYQIRRSINSLSDPVPIEQTLELAGPRGTIFFDSANVRAGIITCGGLCPGLNDVIRAIVLCLRRRYGVSDILGIRYGYRGLLPEFGLEPMALTREAVEHIHREGGTILASSRGHGRRTPELLDAIADLGINMLFVIGGDGTQRGALDLSDQAQQRGMRLSVVGVPKTIDNDLILVDRTFGFDTAVALATQAVAGAHVEARDAVNGIGIVKLMGRESGFIAACAALAENDADFVLIPEVPFSLDGGNGLLSHIEKKLDEQGHVLVVLAEGAGQEHLGNLVGTDPSGNRYLGDIGLFLKQTILGHFGRREREVNVKYIDPSYIIRSAPADAHDSLYCAELGRNAAHAAMSGKTGMLTSMVNGQFVHVPIREATSKRRTIDPDGSLWRSVLESTGQPPLMID